MTRFDHDTALIPKGEGTFGGRIDPGWRIARGPNGGHIAAILLRGLKMTVDDPARHARSLTVHYARPPAEGPITVHTTIERAGRSVSTTSGRMFQDDRLIALAVAAFSAPFETREFDDTQMPQVPPPEDLDPRADRPEMPFLQHFDFRWAIGSGQLGESDRASSAAWMRMREARVADDLLVAQFMDAWAPAVHQKIPPKAFGVPTIDMTVHFREPLPLPDARPQDWYLGTFRTRKLRQGFLEEDGELWTSDGVLVAQSRQHALVGDR
jgi:acyl-CoA thioesterase